MPSSSALPSTLLAPATAPTAVTICRLCGSDSMVQVLALGDQALTGVFPRPGEDVMVGPLTLVWCSSCTLLQLGHRYPPEEMYGDNYGYRSGLNQSMVEHLHRKVQRLQSIVGLRSGDLVLDIGSNDGTTLAQYQAPGIRRLGIDPTASKFRQYYQPGIEAVETFFTEAAFWGASDRPAKVITSIAMFYDLEDPVQFAREVASCLSPDGIWHFEQSYMPSMLRSNSYDTICHEHVEYYSLQSVARILAEVGLEVIEVRFNRVNGGSFAVTAAKRSGMLRPQTELIDWFFEQEKRMSLSTPWPLREFERRVYQHRDDLTDLIRRLRASGATVAGYGASTKGNVLLQFCGLGPDDLVAIAEVNPDKYGRVTPGSNIPIMSEADVRALRPDYLLVLPWHFREGIVQREAEYLSNGGRLIFPLPEIEIVGD